MDIKDLEFIFMNVQARFFPHLYIFSVVLVDDSPDKRSNVTFTRTVTLTPKCATTITDSRRVVQSNRKRDFPADEDFRVIPGPSTSRFSPGQINLQISSPPRIDSHRIGGGKKRCKGRGSSTYNASMKKMEMENKRQ